MDRDQRIVSKEHWARTISQGAQLSMSMVIMHLRGQPGLCPQPDCKGVGEKIGGISNLMSWYVFAPVV